MMNVGNPDRAFDFAAIPHRGVGLARLEFIINRMIGVHPRALLDFDNQSAEFKEAIRRQIAGYADPVSFYVDKLAEGIAQIAAAFAPEPVIVRLSDFKSNEYANLIGGKRYEPHEENPMLGFRGASRYIDKAFRPCFELECRALKRVRDEMGLTNVQIMVPFVRTLAEAKAVTELLADNGLKRGDNGLKHIMMCELPTNAVLADQYLEYFDGMSIGSNDMTQLDARARSRLCRGRQAVRRARRRGQGAACRWRSRPARRRASTSGSAARGPPTIPNSPAGWSIRASTACRLNPDTVVETWMFLAGTVLAEGLAAHALATQETLAVELEFAYRFAHVVERQMRGGFWNRLRHMRRPALRQLLERAHVEIAVVEEPLERRHVPREKAPVLADAVAAHRRAARAPPRSRGTPASRASAAAVSIRLAQHPRR